MRLHRAYFDDDKRAVKINRSTSLFPSPKRRPFNGEALKSCPPSEQSD
jgi:hypothetical protein